MIRFSLPIRVLMLMTATLTSALLLIVVVLSLNARDTVLEQTRRDVDTLTAVLTQALGDFQRVNQEVEDQITREMTNTAQAIALLVAAETEAGSSDDEINFRINQLETVSTIDEIWVTDEHGKVTHSSGAGTSFTFSPDSLEQPDGARFWPLLTGQRNRVSMEIARRELDGIWYKYVAVAGVDRPRIVRVGKNVESIVDIQRQLGIERLVSSLIEQRRVEGVYVVDSAMQTVLIEDLSYAGSDLAQQQEILQQSLQSGEMITRIQPATIDVYSPLNASNDMFSGAVLVRLSRAGLDHLLAQQIRIAVAVVVVGMLLAAALSFYISKRIVRPLWRLSRAAAGVQAGDFELARRLKVKGDSGEIDRLLGVFRSMANDVERRERQLDALVTERTHDLESKNEALNVANHLINDQLDIARELQLAILPARFPNVPGLDGVARMVPALEMGGDFYDIIELHDGRIGVVVADVSGKGVPAGFFMAVARTVIRAVALNCSDAGRCLQEANNELLQQNPKTLFVTVSYLIFDPWKREVELASAGHEAPLLRKVDGRVLPIPVEPGIAMGLVENADYPVTVVQLQPGDLIMTFTDGITEAENAERALFGRERLIKQLYDIGPGSAEQLLERVFQDVRRFAEGAPQSDDITATVIRLSE